MLALQDSQYPLGCNDSSHLRTIMEKAYLRMLSPVDIGQLTMCIFITSLSDGMGIDHSVRVALGTFVHNQHFLVCSHQFSCCKIPMA